MHDADPSLPGLPIASKTGAQTAAIHLLQNPPPREALEPIMVVMREAFDPIFGEAWNKQQVLGTLMSPLCQTIIARDRNDEAMGFSLSRRVQQEEELLLIAVRPQFRGLSIGKALLQQLLQSAKLGDVQIVHLEMRAENPAAHLYKAFDFQVIGQRHNYYTGMDGQRHDAITFARRLNAS
jgi:ribosomal-protein-alanine N-acetyltransferase